MRLGTKLILAFFLLAVLPLTWITLYSYKSSISAFRKVEEAESGALAEQMGTRMGALQRELSYRMERLANFPFQQLMEMQEKKVDPKSNPLMAELLAVIGDTAPLVDSIEFNRAQSMPQTLPGPPRTSSSRGASSRPTRAGSNEAPQNLVIHLSPESSSPTADKQPGAPQPAQEGIVMHLRPSGAAARSEGPPPAPIDAEKEKVAEQLKQLKEFQVELEKMQANRGTGARAGRAAASPDAARQTPTKTDVMQHVNPLAGNFGSEVRQGTVAVGTVQARFSNPQIFGRVLSGSRRRQGEIPFLLDTDKMLHTVTPSDQTKLESLGVSGADLTSGVQTGSSALKDWVVVTHKDEASGLTFGIARPISEPLKEIRNTAARNLGYGLAAVGLALLGIIPLAHGMTRNLAALSRGADQLARGDLSARVTIRSRDEIGRLAESFNRMAHDIGLNEKHLIEQERWRKELEMCRRIQEELLPKQPLLAGSVEVGGIAIPAQEVGGDFFNYFPLPNGEVAVLIGDVSGKGVAAALLMANIQATLRARLPLVTDLAQLAVQLDKETESNTPTAVYLTLFMGILNPRECELRYVNAGHYPPFALHSGGNLDRLDSTGRPLGLLSGGGYFERRVKLAKGDALFLYTDGLVDAQDASGAEFGQQRLETLVLAASGGSIHEILTHVEDEIRKYRGDIEAGDDATMLALKINA
jgi:serine phosphatase RsbU (regulator of sigma subunit)